MTEFEDVKRQAGKTAEEVQEAARELEAKLKASKGWNSWKGRLASTVLGYELRWTPTTRFLAVGAVICIVAALVGKCAS